MWKCSKSILSKLSKLAVYYCSNPNNSIAFGKLTANSRSSFSNSYAEKLSNSSYAVCKPRPMVIYYSGIVGSVFVIFLISFISIIK